MRGLRCIYCGRGLSAYNPTVCGMCLGAAYRIASRELSRKYWGGEENDLLFRWHDDHRRHLVQPLINHLIRKSLRDNPEDPRLW